MTAFDVERNDALPGLPLITVAVCTRERPNDLRRCLESLSRLDHPSLDVLVVDNAPTSNAADSVVRDFSGFRYVCEPRPGLNWARNRAILEARGEIIGYIDDDAFVDPGWAYAVASVFNENAEVMAVTGLVLPQELATEAQVFFEQYGGFGCGFRRRRFDWSSGRSWRGEMMECGTGANMAFRRSVFERIGLFDPALDVGTPTAGGGDIEMFFRVLKQGGVLVYEPAAVVRHSHRRDYAALRAQIESWGSGTVAVLARSAAAFPDERARLIRLGVRSLLRQARRLLASVAQPPGYPRGLLVAELKGTLRGFGLYKRSRRLAASIERVQGPLVQERRP
jgi:GT2 family glycosyltransferase